MPQFQLHQGHVLDVLRALPAESVHCVVTSPPYFGLRSYGTEPQVWGGVSSCDHVWETERVEREMRRGVNLAQSVASTRGGGKKIAEVGWQRFNRDSCPSCGAWRGELGLEPTPELFIEHTVEVFREVRRVLRSDGVLFVNIGDSYASTPNGSIGKTTLQGSQASQIEYRRVHSLRKKGLTGDLKHKDLIGIPWMLAFALRADGWYLRSEIIWHKLNPMPESVKDRPTKSHEQIFLLTKSPRYFFDMEAVREPQTGNAHSRGQGVTPKTVPHGGLIKANESFHRSTSQYVEVPGGRNVRSVWSMATQAYSEDHYAAFPEELAERCVSAGTSERGCCAACDAPWKRIVEASGGAIGTAWHDHQGDLEVGQRANRAAKGGNGYKRETKGWKPSCSCDAEVIPCTVLDPFTGRGTTGVVANRMGRNFVGCELKPEYLQMARKNISKDAPLLNED